MIDFTMCSASLSSFRVEALVIAILARIGLASKEQSPNDSGEPRNSTEMNHDRLRILHKDAKMLWIPKHGYSAEYVFKTYAPNAKGEMRLVLVKASDVGSPDDRQKAFMTERMDYDNALAAFRRETDPNLANLIPTINGDAEKIFSAIPGTEGLDPPRCIVPFEAFEGDNSLYIQQLRPRRRWYRIDDSKHQRFAYSVQEYGGINLCELVAHSRVINKEIPRQEIAQTFYRVLANLKAMHTQNLVHRDPGMGNILRGGILVDFGSCQFLNDGESTHQYTSDGTKDTYRLPYIHEALRSRKKGTKFGEHCLLDKETFFAADLWHCMLMLFTLITREDFLPQIQVSRTQTRCIYSYTRIEERLLGFINGTLHPTSGPKLTDDRKAVLRNVHNLLQLIGDPKEKPLEKYSHTVTISMIMDDLLGNACPILLSWLNPKDSKIVEEKEAFDAAYIEKFKVFECLPKPPPKRRRLNESITAEKI